MIAAPCDFQAFQETSKLKYQEAVYCLNYRDKRLSPSLSFQPPLPNQNQLLMIVALICCWLQREGKEGKVNLIPTPRRPLW